MKDSDYPEFFDSGIHRLDQGDQEKNRRLTLALDRKPVFIEAPGDPHPPSLPRQEQD